MQNVWFRDGCASEARAVGVDGWIRNLPDGRVEAVFEGAPDAVGRVVMWCHDGPTRARVTRVEVRDELPLPATGDEADGTPGRGFFIR